jgi:hypothetical protein
MQSTPIYALHVSSFVLLGHAVVGQHVLWRERQINKRLQHKASKKNANAGNRTKQKEQQQRKALLTGLVAV